MVGDQCRRTAYYPTGGPSIPSESSFLWSLSAHWRPTGVAFGLKEPWQGVGWHPWKPEIWGSAAGWLTLASSFLLNLRADGNTHRGVLASRTE